MVLRNITLSTHLELCSDISWSGLSDPCRRLELCCSKSTGSSLTCQMPSWQLETEEASIAPRLLGDPLTTAEPTLACENCTSTGYQIRENVGWCRGSDVCVTHDSPGSGATWFDRVARCWQACEPTAAISRAESDLCKLINSNIKLHEWVFRSLLMRSDMK